jgi:hypothetical protein
MWNCFIFYVMLDVGGGVGPCTILFFGVEFPITLVGVVLLVMSRLFCSPAFGQFGWRWRCIDTLGVILVSFIEAFPLYFREDYLLR